MALPLSRPLKAGRGLRAVSRYVCSSKGDTNGSGYAGFDRATVLIRWRYDEGRERAGSDCRRGGNSGLSSVVEDLVKQAQQISALLAAAAELAEVALA
jgi:hypothetical protein